MTSNEFSPYRYFTQILDLWWIVFLTILLGGIFGFLFNQLHPPLYEATATYLVTIDLTRFPLQGMKEDLIQYNEDLAVNTTQGVLLSSEVLNELVNQLKTKGISLTTYDVLQNYTIERKHEVWELRFRSHIPQNAQTIVNTWAQIGYPAMLSWQASGEIPQFVIFQPPSLALLPTRPVVYGRNDLMLAGALMGLVVGIIVSTRLSRGQRKNLPGVENPPDL